MKCISALFMTLVFEVIGRLGEIGSIWTACKILTLSTEIKKSAGALTPWEYPLSK